STRTAGEHGAARAVWTVEAPRGQWYYCQHCARQRTVDCPCRRAVLTRCRKHGGRRLHVRVPDSRRAVRAGSRRVERRRAAQSRTVEARCSDQRTRRRDLGVLDDVRLSLAFSPCPNDCFMFDAMVHRRIDLEGLEFDVRLADIEALNTAA